PAFTHLLRCPVCPRGSLTAERLTGRSWAALSGAAPAALACRSTWPCRQHQARVLDRERRYRVVVDRRPQLAADIQGQVHRLGAALTRGALLDRRDHERPVPAAQVAEAQRQRRELGIAEVA